MTGSLGTPGPQIAPGVRCPDCDAPYYTGIEAWFRACAPRLRRLVRSWECRGAHVDADDIVQDTFSDLCKQISTVDNPGGWLIEVARRKVARIREATAQMAAGDAGELLQDPRLRVRWISLAQPAEPEDGLQLRATLHAMAALPQGQRISLYLAKVKGWTHAEIADYLGIKPATVAVHIHHARAALSGGQQRNKDQFEFHPGVGWVRERRSPHGEWPDDDDANRQSPVWVWCRCWNGEPHRWVGDD